MRGLASALISFFINMIGYGLGPLVVGALNDVLSPRFGVEAIRYSLLSVIALAVVAAALCFAANGSVEEDYRRARACDARRDPPADALLACRAGGMYELPDIPAPLPTRLPLDRYLCDQARRWRSVPLTTPAFAVEQSRRPACSPRPAPSTEASPGQSAGLAVEATQYRGLQDE
ncbi:MAG: hypothetical protein VCA57_17230 [Pseudomonas sp.]|uniref:hypothetical protein n=1 Tax=Pseudomonas sp. TaxID=306 RepID=UPI003981E5A1